MLGGSEPLHNLLWLKIHYLSTCFSLSVHSDKYSNSCDVIITNGLFYTNQVTVWSYRHQFQWSLLLCKSFRPHPLTVDRSIPHPWELQLSTTILFPLLPLPLTPPPTIRRTGTRSKRSPATLRTYRVSHSHRQNRDFVMMM